MANEEQPLFMDRRETPDEEEENTNIQPRGGHSKLISATTILLLAACLLIGLCYWWPKDHHISFDVVDIYHAQEYRIQVDDGISLWFRTWGNASAVPVLFVHGGPGGAVEDYHNGNQRFFDKNRLFVVEVDQRGTGRSQPSVRDDWQNMKLYQNISIATISNDYEKVRSFLGIDRWVVWGGSYGSTIGIDYATRYPGSTLSLILRGVYLDTEPEMDEVYSQKAFLGDPKKLADFRQLYEYADKHASTDQSHGLDPDDSYAITKAYEQMIARGDEMAMWQWYVFENNLMEEDPQNLLDPNKIVETKMAEAQSTAFFETRFWIHETWEIPSNFFGRVDRLTNIPIWICQGLRDKVCPPQNAHHLVESMRSTTRSAPIHDRFIESGHEDTDPVMEECLVESMDEFLQSYH